MGDADELMAMFEDFSKPIKQFKMPSMVEVLPIIEDKRSTQTMERTEWSGHEYSFQGKHKEQKLLAMNFSKMNLNMSGLTGASFYNQSSNRSEVNTTVTDRTELNINFAPNNHRKDLPIYQHRDEIVQQINDNPIVIITGLTGCGKTTQVPQYIYDNWKAQSKEKRAELGDCNILVSQPRKIAAITIAHRVADDRKCQVGDLVGYQVGLKKERDNRVDVNKVDNEDRTKILYCTTGVILQRLIHERSMQRYSHIIIDEIHERDIDTDFLLIVIRRMLSSDAPKTKIIIMSATMDVNQYTDYFKIPTLSGPDFYPPALDLLQIPRTYKIQEYFIKEFESLATFGTGKTEDYVNYDEPGISHEMYEFGANVVAVCLRQMSRSDDYKSTKNGTILVFLPGLHEIECFYKSLQSDDSKNKIIVKPNICILHSYLSSEEQRSALLPGVKPKIILSTNIAESSLTIPRVTHVIDFCLTKYQSLAKGAQLSSLVLNWSSKQNSKQRAGRCGRLANGIVIRMVHEDFYTKRMEEYPAPEMTRIGLETVILKTKAFNMGSPMELLALALDAPDKSSIVDSILHLKELGGMMRFSEKGKFNYEDGELTFLGVVMESLPVDPRIAKLIVIGYLFSVLDEAIIIGAGLNNKSIFINNFGKKIDNYTQKMSWSHGSGSDCIAILNAYKLWVLHESTRLQPQNDDEWCRRHNLDFKNLSEMSLLIKEVTRRLEDLKIGRLENQPTWTDSEKIFILKICMAGAFGASNFFVPDKTAQDFEREAFKSINDGDLFRSVVFRNMNRNHIGNIYEGQIRNALIAKGAIDRNTDVEFTFNYLTSEKILVKFGNDKRLVESEDEQSGVGKVLPEVYKAVKFRQVDGRVVLNVLKREEMLNFAAKHGLGTLDNASGSFELNKRYVKNPHLYVLPTFSTTKMEGVITHVENANKFFFRPVIAFNENLRTESYRYDKENMKLQKTLNATDITPVNAPLNKRQLLVVKENGSLHRAWLISKMSPKSSQVKLIDSGYVTTVDDSSVFTIDDEFMEKALLEYPPQVFECTLSHIQPSFIRSRDGKWSPKAVKIIREKVAKHRAIIRIYSVVEDIASVQLYLGDVNVNKKLVQKQYAEDCEESYLSKLNHEYRQERRSEESKPEEEFATKTEKMLKLVKCPLPPIDKCIHFVTLHGPFSPLETSLNGISRFCSKKVNIDQSSVNSVILNDDILNFRSKFYVAADVSVGQSKGQLILRDVNMMPNIPGLAALLALIFGPTAEVRRNEDKSRFVSLLTGLGFDKERGQPFFGEHDAYLDIDFELSREDIDKINQIRYAMSIMLLSRPGCNYLDMVDGDKVASLKIIQSCILDLLNKQRPLRAAEPPANAFDWNVDQRDIFSRTDPNGNAAIYGLLNLPRLYEMSADAKNKLKLHAVELIKCSKNSLTLHDKVCRLCAFEWTTTQELKLHLLSLEHVNQCDELTK